MKKIYIFILIVFLSLTAGVVASENIVSDTEADNLVESAKDFVMSYFIPVNGTVADVADGRVTVKFEGDQNIKNGMRFSVYTEGEPFYHPVTKELLGSTEEFAGKIEIVEPKGLDGLYACTVISGKIKTGDIARISTSKIKLAFFQDKRTDWALSEAFYSSLKDSGRFELLESYAPRFVPDELLEIARDMNAEAVLLFSTPLKDQNKVLDIRLYWAEDSKLFAGREEAPTGDAVHMISPLEEFIPDSFADKEPMGTYRLAAGQFFTVGDVDGDSDSELVVSDGNVITIYTLKEHLQEIWSLKGNSQERHLSIDVLDTNNNGKAEIFVTYMTGNGSINTYDSGIDRMKSGSISVKSFVLESDPAERFKRIADNMPYFFRVSGKTLLMQKFNTGRIFAGPVHEGEWEDGIYQPKKQIALPADVNIYGFTFIDWHNNGVKHIMTFDDNGYLILYDSRGNEIWKSSKSYGRFRLSFEKDIYSVTTPLEKWYIRGRLISVKTDRGGEVIVVNNIPFLSNVPGLGARSSEIYSLWWDNGEMEEKLLVSEIQGGINDYWVEGSKLFFIIKENLWSVIKNAASGEISRGSVLYYYDLGGQ